MLNPSSPNSPIIIQAIEWFWDRLYEIIRLTQSPKTKGVQEVNLDQFHHFLLLLNLPIRLFVYLSARTVGTYDISKVVYPEDEELAQTSKLAKVDLITPFFLTDFFSPTKIEDEVHLDEYKPMIPIMIIIITELFKSWENFSETLSLLSALIITTNKFF
jgi:hypothetical protein